MVDEEGLRVVGVGLGRTGTLSLKAALEQLLGAPCYHMIETFRHPEHVALWHEAVRGRPDWRAIFRGYRAAVDWPTASFWPELVKQYPDALVLLSLRDAESWWRSVHATIFPSMPEADARWRAMLDDLYATRFTTQLEDREACIAAYERHNAAVRAAVPPSRLLEWRASDGWPPLCAALGLPVPDAPFPHHNSTEDFLRLRGTRRARAT